MMPIFGNCSLRLSMNDSSLLRHSMISRYIDYINAEQLTRLMSLDFRAVCCVTHLLSSLASFNDSQAPPFASAESHLHVL
jgi:hypothetical protein